MCTSGLLSIIYNGKIYSFYNHYDSGIDYFGRCIITEFIEILKDEDKLLAFKNCFEAMNAKIDDKSDSAEVHEIDLSELTIEAIDTSKSNYFGSILQQMKEFMDEGDVIENVEYYDSKYKTQYSYIIDLEENVFCIRGSSTEDICLNNVPLKAKNLEALVTMMSMIYS